MRIRTLVAGVVLALFAAVLGAPAAYAAPDDDGQPSPGQPGSSQPAEEPDASVSVPEQVTAAQSFAVAAGCGVDDASVALSASSSDISFNSKDEAEVAEDAAPGTYTVTLVCANDAGTDQATDTLEVVTSAAVQGPVEPAALSVEPDEVGPGERFEIDFSCPAGPDTTTVTADPGVVDFDADLEGGKVDDNAPDVDATITLRCPNGDTAQDVLRVRSDRRHYLDLDPNDGYRDDKVEVEAYCPGTADATLNSPVLDDITLKRDGNGVLRGKTRVEDDAEFGDSFAEVFCAGGQQPSDDFFVLEHRGSRDVIALRATIGEMAQAIDGPPRFMSLHWKRHRQIAEAG